MRGDSVRVLVAALCSWATLGASALASPLSTPWAEAHGAKARLFAGAALARGSDAPRLFAAVEISMSPGWKTYWRSPGDSGGLPPNFDWSGSVNLASAEVLYPAPRRFRDAAGDSVGYAKSVVFPVELRPQDPAKPVELRLSLDYGICREICVPAEAKLSLPIPAGATVAASPQITTALEAVPRSVEERQPHDPELKVREAHLGTDKPKLILEAVFPGSAASGDMFIEAPDGVYVPLPARVAQQGDRVRFEVDLTQGAEPEELRGRTVSVTMVSDSGHSVARWRIE